MKMEEQSDLNILRTDYCRSDLESTGNSRCVRYYDDIASAAPTTESTRIDKCAAIFPTQIFAKSKRSILHRVIVQYAPSAGLALNQACVYLLYCTRMEPPVVGGGVRTGLCRDGYSLHKFCAGEAGYDYYG